MLIKSMLRLKTYVAVLLISLIIFSISIPLSISLAQGYGEDRARTYGELLRPNAEIVTTLSPDENVINALYLLLTNESPPEHPTIKEKITVYENIYDLVYEPWLKSQRDNPIYLNSSNPVFRIPLGTILIYEYKKVDVTGLTENEIGSILSEVSQAIINDLYQKLQIKIYRGPWSSPGYWENPPNVGITTYILDNNTRLVLGSLQIYITAVTISNLTDLWHIGFDLSQEIPNWQNTIFIDNNTKNILQLINIYDNGKMIIGNKSYNVLVLNKTLTTSYYNYNPYLVKPGNINIYIPYSMVPSLLANITNDKSLGIDSFLGSLILYQTSYYAPPSEFQDLRNTTLSAITYFKNRQIIFVSDPEVYYYNGYVQVNSTQLIADIINSSSQITNTSIQNLTSLFYDYYLEKINSYNTIMSVFIEYNSIYIYSSPVQDIYNNVNEFYFSLLDQINETRSYIYDLLNQTNTSIEPYRTLYYIIKAEKSQTTSMTTTLPMVIGGEENYSGPRYYRLMSGVNAFGLEITLSSDKLDYLVSLRTQNWDPIGAMSLISLIPIVLLIGYTSSTEALTLIITTSRRWLAVSLSRGAYLKKVFSRMKLLLAGIGLIIAVAGIALSSILSIHVLGLKVESLYYIEQQYKSSLILLPTIILVPVVSFLATRNSIKQIEDLSPLEAIRPVESIKKISTSRRKVVGSFIIILFTLISLVLGVTRPDVEDLFDTLASNFGGAGVAVLGMIIFGGIMISPFVPLIIVYYLSKYLADSTILFRLLDKFVAKLFGKSQIGSLAVNSSYRIRELLKSPMRSSIISLSVLFGTLMSEASIIKTIYPWINSYNTENVLGVSGIYSATKILVAVGLVGAAALLAVYPAVMARTFDYIKGHVAILRVRGADKKTLISYVYISFLPSLLALLLTAAIVSIGFLISMDSTLGVAFIDSWGSPNFNMPHLYPYLQGWQIPLIAGIISFILILPAILAYRVAVVRDLARYLKEEVF